MNSNTFCDQSTASDYDVFIGLDVDKHSIALTTRDRTGMGKSLKMSYDPEILLSYVHNHFDGKNAAFVYEAGPTGFGLYDAITEKGYPCIVVAPQSVPVTRGKRVKTNRLDSIKLADLLRGGQLSGIRVPPLAYRELRELTSLRNSQVDAVRAAKCRVKSLLLCNSLTFPDSQNRWSKRVIVELRKLNCNKAVFFKLNTLLDDIEWHQRQALRTQVALRQLIESEPEFALSLGFLMSMPGVGWIIASYTLARVGDWRLLGQSDEMSSFMGLVPCENSTGDDTNRGSITKAGDQRLRSLLIQGAWTAVRNDHELFEFYERVRKNHPSHTGARIAIVAVARKMAVRMHCLLRERRNYEKK
jgi:transposase